jgi:hypothetical protein
MRNSPEAERLVLDGLIFNIARRAAFRLASGKIVALDPSEDAAVPRLFCFSPIRSSRAELDQALARSGSVFS